VQGESLPTTKRLVALCVVPIVLLAGTVALFNGGIFSSDTEPASIAHASASEARTQPWRQVQSSHSDDNMAMTANVMSVSVAQATPADVVMERAVSSVTHTRAHPVRNTVAPAVTRMRARVTAAAALGPEPSGEVEAPPPAPMVAAPSYSRVTHTKAQQPLRKPAREPRLDPGEVQRAEVQPAGCAPGVAALGLCMNQ
jgi:hypothetical protein